MSLESMAVNLWCSTLSCANGASCQDEGHLYEICKAYDSLVEAIKIFSHDLPQAQEHKNRINHGWNDYCKELYSVARTKFFEWDTAGRIRSGALFDEMKAARTSFQDALKFCRLNEKNIRKDKLLAKFASGNKMDFWKECRNVNGSSKSISQCIDGVSVPSEIISTFENKFMSVLNDPESQTADMSTVSMDQVSDSKFIFTINDLDEVLNKLNTG